MGRYKIILTDTAKIICGEISLKKAIWKSPDPDRLTGLYPNEKGAQ